MKESKDPLNNDQIDVLALIKPVWVKRVFIVKVTLLFFLFGLFVAIFTPKEFRASSMFMPQTGETSGVSGGSLGGLASLAGINVGSNNSSNEIPPDLYPQIAASVNFRAALMNSKLKLDGVSDKVTYGDYYKSYIKPSVLGTIRQYTIGLPRILIAAVIGNSEESITVRPSKEQIRSLSPDEVDHFRRIGTQLVISPDSKKGFVTISFIMPDASLAAQMAKHAEVLLQDEVKRFKVQKATEELNYVEETYLKKKEAFEKIQTDLAVFRDRNQNLSSAMASNELQKLQSKYDLAFGLYNDFAKQLEQSKLQLNKDTPIFRVLQEVTVPANKSSPNRPMILISITIVGLLVTVAFVFIQLLYIRYRDQLKLSLSE